MNLDGRRLMSIVDDANNPAAIETCERRDALRSSRPARSFRWVTDGAFWLVRGRNRGTWWRRCCRS